jgi:magnesium transporter
VITIRTWSPTAGLVDGHSTDRIPSLLEAPDTIVWVDLVNPGEEGLAVLRDVFRFHPLAIEDCIGESHHPKVEAYNGYMFLVSHGVVPDSTVENFRTRELDVFLGPKFIVTHHQGDSRSIDALAQHLQANPAEMGRGPDHLLYRILDQQVDLWVDVLDVFDDRLEELEERIFHEQGQKILDGIFEVRRSIMRLRRIATHQRETLVRLTRGEFPQVGRDAALYLRDVLDHLVRVTDLAELYRELIGGILEAYLSVVSNRLNDVMRVLTVFASVFIPITFLTSLYGMNFQYMPELQWKWSYPLLWVVMLSMAGGVLWWFRRKKFV